MRTVIIVLLAILFSGNGLWSRPQEQAPFYYLNIGFLRGKTYAENMVFDDLALGIVVYARAPYKVLLDEKVVSSGLLSPGLNIINLYSQDLKEEPGLHIYKLMVIRNDVIFIKKIELSILWRQQPKKKKQVVIERTVPLEYDLSMYLGSKRVAGGKKRIAWRMREERTIDIGRGPPAGQMDQRDGSYPNLNAINLLGVVSYLINRAKQKKMKQALKGKLLVHQTPLTFIKKISEKERRTFKGLMSIRIIDDQVRAMQ